MANRFSRWAGERVGARGASLRWEMASGRLTRDRLLLAVLACDLCNLGDEFHVFRDLDGPLRLPYRPVKVDSVEMRWVDCHRSIVWGLGKRNLPLSPGFLALIAPLVEGSVQCLPVAADELERDLDEAGRECPDLLGVLRKPRF